MKKRLTKRRLLAWVLLAVGLIIMLRWFEYHQVYHPGRRMSASGAALGRPWEDVYFEARDGVKLNAWFYPATTNSPRAGWVVLVSHGNAGNISDRLELYSALLETGVAVLAYDFRGYGLSHGRPGEEGTYLDAQAAYQWLRQEGFAGSHIINYGESLGGGVACELCVREPTGGLILQSTFTSIPDIGAELFPWLPVRWMSTIKYDTRARLPRLKIPVLVMHAREDGLIPFHHGEANFAAANEPKLFWEIRGDHNDPLLDRARFVAGIEKFLSLVQNGQ